MAWQATKSAFDTDVNTLMPRNNSRILLIKDKLGVTKEVSNYIFVSISGDKLYTLEILQAFQKSIDDIMEIPEVEQSLNPFNFISFENDNKRIKATTLSPSGRAPLNEAELAEFKSRIIDNALSENFVAADKGRILTAAFINRTVDNIPLFTERLNAAIAPLEAITDVYYTGETPFQDRIAYYLVKDFSLLLILALIAMLTIFWLSFRSLRAIILPILVVIIGAIWSMGFMAIVGVKITVVTVIIPSLILTIGSSYTIHVLNEYYRNENSLVSDKREWLANAVEHVIRTVIVAALTTMVSFLSLLTTTLTPLQEFGLSISLGIFFCAVLALFFLPAVFYLLPVPKAHQRERINRGIVTRFVVKLGGWSLKHPFRVLGIFITMFLLFVIFYPQIMHQSDYFSYFPSNDPIIEGSRFINKNSGGSQTFNITLQSKDGKKNFFLDPDVLKKVDSFERIIKEHPSVTNKISFAGILSMMNKAYTGSEGLPESRGFILLLNRIFQLIPEEKIALGQDSSIINKDGTSITIYLKVAEADTYSILNENDMREFLNFINLEMEASFDDAFETYIWGNTLLVLDSSRTIKRDQLRSTLISMLLGMLITWLFFRSIVYSVIAILPLVSGIFFYFITLYIFRIPLDMTTILVTNVTVGVGLDDAVHFILQYRKQHKLQKSRLALNSSLRFTGRPIVLTTLSLIAGMLVLCTASFKPIVFFGFLIAGTLFSTMMGTIIFIPVAINFYERFKERKLVRESSSI